MSLWKQGMEVRRISSQRWQLPLWVLTIIINPHLSNTDGIYDALGIVAAATDGVPSTLQSLVRLNNFPQVMQWRSGSIGIWIQCLAPKGCLLYGRDRSQRREGAAILSLSLYMLHSYHSEKESSPTIYSPIPHLKLRRKCRGRKPSDIMDLMHTAIGCSVWSVVAASSSLHLTSLWPPVSGGSNFWMTASHQFKCGTLSEPC